MAEIEIHKALEWDGEVPYHSRSRLRKPKSTTFADA